MVSDIISQIFGYNPNIHDIIIAIVSLMFGFILLPQLRDVIKGKVSLNLFTASLTTIGLVILTVNFFAMEFWISFSADLFSSIVWFLLFIYSYKNIKKKKLLSIS
jgi:hypothetical protein